MLKLYEIFNWIFICDVKRLSTLTIFLVTTLASDIVTSTPNSVEKKPAVSSTFQLRLSERERHWLDNHPKIRIGAMNDWPPMDFVDNEGVAQGIGARFVEALNQRLNNSLEIVSGSWVNIYADVQEKHLDALMGITPREDRNDFFNFTKPYIKIPHAIFARKDSRYLKSLNDLKGKIVSVERGFFIVGLLKDKYPDVEVREYDSTSNALDALVKGEVDAYVGNRAVAMYIIDTELISNIKQHGKISETSSINAIGVRKDWGILRDILEKALDDISTAEHRKILSKWNYSDNTSSSRLNLSLKEKNWLKMHSVVRMAFDENYPPYSYRNEKGNFVGIAVDYARELAERAGITIEIYPDGKWKELYAAAQRREVDVIATLVKQEARKEWFDFTRPYISLAQYIITSKENSTSISHPKLLAGKKVALIENYSMTRVVLKENPDVVPYYVSNLSEALEAVSTGKAEATIGAIGMSNYMISKASLVNLGFASLYSKGQSEQRFGVRNDWPELASILDKALHSLSDTEVIEIFERWTRPEVAKAEAELFDTTVSLTDEERIWLSKNSVIRTASDPNWAPIEFIDEKGNQQGISANYVGRLEKILGIKFERVKDQTWQEMVDNFKKGDIDLFTSVNHTPEREKFIHFTESYTHFPVAIFSGSESQFVIDMKELKGKSIGVVKGYATQELMETNYPEIELVTASDPIAALDMLSHGTIDAYVGNILVTNYYIGKLGYTHIKIIGKTPFQYDQSMGVRKDWPIFVSILDKALNEIPETEKNAIYNQWIGVRLEHGFDYELLWKVLLVVLILFAAFTYWNRKLTMLNKQLVLARDQEEYARKTVEQANEQLKSMDKLKSMFIASMSHELRTPLNSIIGFSGLLLHGVIGELAENQKDSVQRINKAGNHLLSLISDIIDISKIEAGRVDVFPEKFFLKELIEDAVESIRPQADAKSIVIEIVCDNWPEITTDRQRLFQCILNYLSNAVKYSEQGKITLTVLVKKEIVEISVADTGIGIAEKDMPKLFDAFERMDSRLRVKAGGTGLGLYLTKKIISELLDGSVSVESQINKGSTFSLELPINVSKTKASKQ